MTTRFLRAIAALVLLIGACQIAMCAVDCDCFLPAPVGISSHANSQGDADGCLCCAHCASVPDLVAVSLPLQFQFVRSPLARQIIEAGGLNVYRPPRS
jgi:hypothetical protein